MAHFLHISIKNLNTLVCIQIIRKRSGISIVELLIVCGLLAGGFLAISKLAADIYKFQRDTVSLSEANEFSSAIGYYLNQNCQSELQGKEFPFTQPAPLVLTKYGSWGNTPVSTIEAGKEFDDKWRVKNITWEHKSSIPLKEYKRSGQDLKVAVARITLETEIIREEGNDASLNHYSIEIPFIVDAQNKVIDCLAGSLGPTGEDMCETMGAGYDPITDMCIPKKHCFVVTQLVNCTSNKGWNPKYSAQSPCEELILPHITLKGQKQYFNFYHSDSGGALGNCPSGTKMIFTGNIIKMGSISCGSGCTNTYVSEGKVYLCMKCDKGQSSSTGSSATGSSTTGSSATGSSTTGSSTTGSSTTTGSSATGSSTTGGSATGSSTTTGSSATGSSTTGGSATGGSTTTGGSITGGSTTSP